MHKVKLHYLKKLTLYLKLLILNQIKFKHAFLLELRYLISQIYNKNVEFNLINLKKMHLNSDIFTQAVALKLKNRDNRLYRVLRSSLSRVKLPNVSRIKEKYIASGLLSRNKEQTLIYKMRNLKINSLFALDTDTDRKRALVNKDSLNKLLLNIFPFKSRLSLLAVCPSFSSTHSVQLKPGMGQEPMHKRPISLRNYVLRSLKHINMAGIRIEAKGRLTRRFTASRSVFKMR